MLVGGGETLCELYPQVYDLLGFQRAGGQLGIETYAGDVFCNQVVRFVLTAKLMHGGDIRMAELGKSGGLFSKSLAGEFVCQHARRQQLDRYIAVQLLVMGTIDHTHATCTNLLDDAIVAERLADELGRGGH